MLNTCVFEKKYFPYDMNANNNKNEPAVLYIPSIFFNISLLWILIH